MGSQVKRIALSGYYGFGNSGDEAVLQSILLALEDEGRRQGIGIEPVVLSIRPEETERTYGVRSVHRMRFSDVARTLRECDGLISGGGSLLQDATGVKTIPYYLLILKIAQFFRKPTFIYAQGVGPVHRPLFYPMIRSVFNRCRYISVRDEESADLLAKMGVKRSRVEVVPDPVMGLTPRERNAARPGPKAGSERSGTKPVIGVSVRFWNDDRSELDGIARALRMIVERVPAAIRLLPFHLPADAEASRYVMDRIGPDLPDGTTLEMADGALHPQDMMAEVGACDLLIGMRLHALIYAAARSVPPVGVSYDPKIDQFLNRLGMKAAGSTDDLRPDRLAEEALRLLEHKSEWLETAGSAIDRLKREARQPAQQIVSILRS